MENVTTGRQTKLHLHEKNQKIRHAQNFSDSFGLYAERLVKFCGEGVSWNNAFKSVHVCSDFEGKMKC